MRKINEIVIDASEGKIPTHEECFWAMLALKSRLHLTKRDLDAISEAAKKGPGSLSLAVRMRADHSFEAHQKFYQQDPQIWLGDSGNPFTEESKQWRDLADNILEKALKKINEKNA